MYTLKSDRKNHLVVTEDVRKELISFSRRCQCCIVRLQIFLGHICRIETLEDKNMHISVNQREGRLFNLGVTTALNVLLFGFTRILSIKWDTEKKKLWDGIRRCQCDAVNKLSFQEHLQFGLFYQVLLKLTAKTLFSMKIINVYLCCIGEKWSIN